MILIYRVKEVLKNQLSPERIERIAQYFEWMEHIILKIDKFVFNKRRIEKVCANRNLMVHVGCGNKRLDGYVNVDMVVGRNVDVVADLNKFNFPNGCCHTIFSHAFFEHLATQSREAHLRGALKSLKPTGGEICYIGIPYFKHIAELYLKGEKGPNGLPFDVSQVCKFTHGGTTLDILDQGLESFQSNPAYLYAELHKALYDEVEIDRLLKHAGCAYYVIFTTVYPKDRNPLPVNIGFYASNISKTTEELQVQCLQYLKKFDGVYLDINSVEFLNI